MLHFDDDDLALVALGEEVDGQDRDHLTTCARCRSRLDELRATVATVRSIGPDDVPRTPPPSVWVGISEELGLVVDDAMPTGAAEEVAPVADLGAKRSQRRARIWLIATAAAVAGVLAGIVATAGIMSTQDSADEVVASTQLAPIDDSGVSGTAAVVRDGDTKLLTIDVPNLPTQSDAYYEVWMATPDTSTMVAIGTLNPGEAGRFVLPAGMDAAAFPVVDISVEHFDGDAGHSATSVARGMLGA